jgi:hypothetical protein
MVKIVLSCRLSLGVPVFSVCGHLFSGWSTMIYLRRSVHGWRLRRGILFPYMSGRIIYGLVLHLHLRRSTITQFDMYFSFSLYFDTLDSWMAVFILVMQRPGVIACLSNESAHFQKKSIIPSLCPNSMSKTSRVHPA